MNEWLRDEYYALMQYVERDDPRDSARPERRVVYGGVEPLEMDAADLRIACRRRGIKLRSRGRSEADLRSDLADATWQGYRMTKDISAEAATTSSCFELIGFLPSACCTN